MARLNVAPKFTEKTYEGAPAARMTNEQALRRSVLSCFLFEDEFYEDGEKIADRIEALAYKVKPSVLAALAIEARSQFNLRHVPLLLLTVLAKTGSGSRLVSDTIEAVIQRADEPGEFLALYWRKGKTPLSAQVKKGLARAIGKFSEYQLAKYNRDAAVKLRDVLFLTHAKPTDDREDLYKRLAANELETPDTWEVALSGGADKGETFTRMLKDGTLGYFALLRNLRNMVQTNVEPDLVRAAIIARKGGAEKILPFRFVAAARAAPMYEAALDQSLLKTIEALPVLPGRTVVLVDVSGSMDSQLSAKSDLKRIDAACALAAMIPGNVRMASFSDAVVEVPPRRGMAGVDALRLSQPHSGTRLFDAVALVNEKMGPYDRLIVITDEQAAGPGVTWGNHFGGSTRSLPDPLGLGYMINVASARNGVGYGKWTHIDGFSEQVLRFIHEHEATTRQ